jgi:hypothetical protein
MNIKLPKTLLGPLVAAVREMGPLVDDTSWRRRVRL